MIVKLPNSNQIKVTHQGKLRIAQDLILDHILLVPNFKFNLLSVKKLHEQL